ncbi:MotA/TolQ/ExbB proton channel family protein [Thioalkalivibrio nitratireducens DSM 14787]|uniref:Biopolymer transport protein ExbB n=1 Tax=Thioalkalivibrio nitratireducens (strain DSM 14787 / UNIQEM 213 / ALEN2) TaxID=1255043 RepID=L0DZH3_THIND|nr:MotA/TolQ/ExbB proton channel family protein [Thioalkalivibrio nitratireducens]AGA34382.1 MotA/TolQ/ExbB proton channel family protein [Thioalkalivibrio nitratireducens DSM 14787]
MDGDLWLGWWGHADLVVRGVFLLLVALSVLSWTVILYKGVQLRRVFTIEQRGAAALSEWSSEGLGNVLRPGSPSSRVFADLRWAHLRGTDRDDLRDLVAHRVRSQRARLETGLVALATTGNTAPFIGLLGTVWGIMHALQALGGAGGAISMDLIAGPVAEALVATAAGLFTAIPAVVGYNLLLRRLRRIMGVLEGNALQMLACSGVPGDGMAAPAAPLRPGRVV